MTERLDEHAPVPTPSGPLLADRLTRLLPLFVVDFVKLHQSDSSVLHCASCTAHTVCQYLKNWSNL